jgi:hypothetical protein
MNKEQGVKPSICHSQETNAIRQRMEEVRCDLDQDIQGIVEGARDMRDWRSYVRSYPWVCVGAAVTIGYLLVPRRPAALQPSAEAIAELVKQSRLAETPLVTPLGKARGILFRSLGNLVIQGVSAYVGQQAGKHYGKLATSSPQAASSPQDGQQ